MNLELELIKCNLKKATKPEDVFGILPGDANQQLNVAKITYRNLAKFTHEDLYPVDEKPVARESFVTLTEWWQQAQDKIANKTYGTNVSTVVKQVYQPREITLRGKKLILEDILATGAFSTVYKADYGLNPREFVFVKVARTPQDNELLEREIETLNLFQLKDSDPTKERDFFSIHRMYIPKPITSFYISGNNGSKHRATILSSPNFRSFNTETLLKEKFPNGIEPKHAWWIFRRMLLTLWMSHLKGVIHGAITPDHVLVYPDDHGLELLDWTCSCKIGKKVVAYNPEYKTFYAPEILEKKPVSPATDIYMAAMTIIYILGGDSMLKNVPSNVSDLLRKCISQDVSKRPQDAEIFHGEFGNALGKKEFAKFIVP